MPMHDHVIENCRRRRDAARDEAERLTEVLRLLGAGEREVEIPYGTGWGADIPVTVDEDTAWATL